MSDQSSVPLGLAIVGYGGAGRTHAGAFRQITGTKLLWAVGRNRNKTRAFAEEFGFAQATTELGEAVADAAVDAVVIATPNRFHHPQALEALQAGKHVLVEIPLAHELGKAKELVDLAERRQLRLSVCHTTRYVPAARHVKRLIEAGDLGRVRQIWCWRTELNIGPRSYQGYVRRWEDDAVFHHSCHIIDIMLWWLGMPEVRVRGSVLRDEPDGLPQECVILMRSSEVLMSIGTSFHAPHPEYDYAIVGDRGVLRIRDFVDVTFNGQELTYPDQDEDDDLSWFLKQDRDFVRAVRTAEPAGTSGREALRALRVCQQVVDEAV